MCLGSSAIEANKAAKRDYEYKLLQRKANWMETMGVTKAQHVQYEQGITASNLGLAGIYGDIQEKYGDLIGQAFQEDEAQRMAFLQESKGASLEASGRTGRSIGRTASLD